MSQPRHVYNSHVEVGHHADCRHRQPEDQLSKYITYVKAGETIVIRDRNEAVAQLMPFPTDDGLDREQRELVAAGPMCIPEKPWDITAFDHLPMRTACNWRRP